MKKKNGKFSMLNADELTGAPTEIETKQRNRYTIETE